MTTSLPADAGQPGRDARRFAQVDVFAGGAHSGNALAVVLDAQDLTDEQMQRFARWTNLSETTFLLPPTTAQADYRVRIFTPSGELPFAGHPTLGSCHAWDSQRGGPAREHIVQECAAGLISIRRTDNGFAFAAPPLLREGPADTDLRQLIATELGLGSEVIRDVRWVDNGPGWVAALLDSADSVLAARTPATTPPLGLVGPHPPGGPYAFEVRAFFPGPTGAMLEDPVTGSLNAGVAQWLIGSGQAPEHYLAHQGTAVGLDGCVSAQRDTDGRIWIGGATTTRIHGQVHF
ncbi:PhzF family phenazine biosynthesis protein [Goodfellowiella coeruleoviolacea]|uniref:Phenazine biosynthesis protein PhzF family n=1 Tax=Goodfellowiella coeruleoviolacea TaxID=334858 RepID=A0AAE3GH35_9PSEU|nr:PhzF family phenazine biosynthesis protein [Goodfellowiella coeruleoviolacea]MCP2167598.1 phenazine biosynthesis protein PhzF family [Goodfellowiella coeruleoviolacea]